MRWGCIVCSDSTRIDLLLCCRGTKQGWTSGVKGFRQNCHPRQNIRSWIKRFRSFPFLTSSFKTRQLMFVLGVVEGKGEICGLSELISPSGEGGAWERVALGLCLFTVICRKFKSITQLEAPKVGVFLSNYLRRGFSWPMRFTSSTTLTPYTWGSFYL